jgi:hypothetical protein
MLTSEPSICALTVEQCVAAWRNALVVVWRRAPSASSIDVAHHHARLLVEQCSGRVGVLCLTQASIPLAGGAERERTCALMESLGDRLVGVATVVEGTGVLAGTTRSVMAAINLVARQPCPLGVFSTVDEAVSWQAPLLNSHGGEPVRAAAFRRVVELVRHRLNDFAAGLEFQ